MKNPIKAFSREQVTGVVAFCFAVIFLLFGIAGGSETRSSGSEGPSEPGIRDFVKPPVLETRIPGADFAPYWRGHDVFQMENSTRPPVPTIAMMFPHANPVALPIFRPHPPLSRYYRVSLAPVPEKALLDPAKLDEVKAIEEPPAPEWVDRRAERESEFDVLIFHSGSPREGTIIAEDADSVRLRVKDGNAVQKWPRDRIKKIVRNWTNEKRYTLSSAGVRKGPGEVAERIKLASWCREKGMIPETRRELEKAVSVTPVKASAVLALGTLYEFESDFEAAVKLYRTALDEVPSEREELHWRIGESLRRLGLYPAALRAFEEGVEVSRSPRGILSYAEMLIRTGDLREVIEIVSDCRRKFDRDTVRFTPELRSRSHFLLGRTRLQEGDFGGAIKDLEKATGTTGDASEVWNSLGVCYAMESKYREASYAFAASIAADQYRTEAWTNLATIYLRASKGDVAEELFSRARERDPSDLLSRNAALLPLLAKGDAVLLDAALSELLEAAPNDFYANYLKGIASLRAGDAGTAYEAFRTSLREEFAFPAAHGGAGRSCLSMAAALARIRAEGDSSPERVRQVLGPVLRAVLGEDGLLDPEKVGETFDRLLLESGAYYARSDRGNDANIQIAYGCIDALSGRGGDAIERFKNARSANSQAGNPSDPVIEYAMGYVEYRFGAGDSEDRLDRARRYFRSAGNGVDWKDAESLRIVVAAGRLATEIEEWRLTSLVEDEDFSRKDSDHLRWRGSQWNEEDGPPRASITVKGNECLISGTPVENMIVTRLERDDLPAEGFNRLDVTFRPRPQDRPSFEFGVSFYDPGRQGANRMGYHVGFDLRRKLRQTQMPEKKFLEERVEMSRQWKELKLKFPLPREIRLRFQRVDENRRSLLHVLVWRPDQEAFEVVGKLNFRGSSRSGKSGMKVSIWARGWQGEGFAVGVDDIRILEKRKR